MKEAGQPVGEITPEYIAMRKRLARKREISDHLFEHACGYGMADEKNGKEDFFECIKSIPDGMIECFIYTLYRIAEKSGVEGFNI